MSIMHSRWGKLYRQTAHECKLEIEIAALGVPYRGQFPGFLYGWHYYPDFYLPTLKLCIEVDDPSHAGKAEKDRERDANLRLLGITTTRVTNAEVDESPLEALHKALRRAGLPTDRRLLLAAQGPMHLPRLERIKSLKSRKGV